jgi:hypothetical protein
MIGRTKGWMSAVLGSIEEQPLTMTLVTTIFGRLDSLNFDSWPCELVKLLDHA